ncbi:MAG: dipeptide ABC transporter ATP-binding protein [Desulfobacterales bacterium]|jgi:oligopeptide/dipeptide ABC transporter ATP-binding protein|nr:dipeptide ABC transporter ATP-binding protein [Desulfobacterales bacterium]
MSALLLEVEGLTKHFAVTRGMAREKVFVRAVDGVDFAIARGETLGLVGESGCGKTTVGRLILRLIEPTGGAVRFDGRELTALDRKRLQPLRRSFQIIFQDPFASLNPRMTVSEIVGRPMEIHGLTRRAERDEKVGELLAAVGLRREQLARYPHEFSGGQRQRIGIARALATRPQLVVADEPTSALDVSVQAQILNLMKDLQGRFGLTYLFISHNIGVIRHISDRVAVMYLGKIVEMAGKGALFSKPLHPYTQALLAAVPSLDPRRRQEEVLLEGDVPSPVNPPPGCRFHTRCRFALPRCSREEPEFRPRADGRWVACHLY